MKDDDFKLLRGFDDRQTNKQTDICDCRVAFASEKPNIKTHMLFVRCQVSVVYFSKWYFPQKDRSAFIQYINKN